MGKLVFGVLGLLIFAATAVTAGATAPTPQQKLQGVQQSVFQPPTKRGAKASSATSASIPDRSTCEGRGAFTRLRARHWH